jgi:hypothetical protein
LAVLASFSGSFARVGMARPWQGVAHRCERIMVCEALLEMSVVFRICAVFEIIT